MEKLYNISVLRAIAMLMLFAHHVLCGILGDGNSSITYFPITMGVEIFLFVSAFLYGNKEIKDFKQFFKKRLLFIFLPYYIFIFIIFLIYLIFLPSMLSAWEITKGTFCLYVFDSSYNSLGHFWFLPIIMIAYCFLPLLQKYYNPNTKQKTKTILKVIFLLIILGEICFSFFGHHLQFTAFFAGYYVAKQKDVNKSNPFYYGMVFLLSVVLYFLVHGHYALGSSEYLRNGIGYMLMFVAGISFSFWLLRSFNFLNKREHKVLNFVDKISYTFYIVHHVLLIKALSVLHITPYLWLNITIALVASVVLAYLLQLCVTGILKLTQKKKAAT